MPPPSGREACLARSRGKAPSERGLSAQQTEGVKEKSAVESFGEYNKKILENLLTFLIKTSII